MLVPGSSPGLLIKNDFQAERPLKGTIIIRANALFPKLLLQIISAILAWLNSVASKLIVGGGVTVEWGAPVKYDPFIMAMWHAKPVPMHIEAG